MLGWWWCWWWWWGWWWSHLHIVSCVSGMRAGVWCPASRTLEESGRHIETEHICSSRQLLDRRILTMRAWRYDTSLVRTPEHTGVTYITLRERERDYQHGVRKNQSHSIIVFYCHVWYPTIIISLSCHCPATYYQTLNVTLLQKQLWKQLRISDDKLCSTAQRPEGAEMESIV